MRPFLVAAGIAGTCITFFDGQFLTAAFLTFLTYRAYHDII